MDPERPFELHQERVRLLERRVEVARVRPLGGLHGDRAVSPECPHLLVPLLNPADDLGGRERALSDRFRGWRAPGERTRKEQYAGPAGGASHRLPRWIFSFNSVFVASSCRAFCQYSIAFSFFDCL